MFCDIYSGYAIGITHTAIKYQLHILFLLNFYYEGNSAGSTEIL